MFSFRYNFQVNLIYLNVTVVDRCRYRVSDYTRKLGYRFKCSVGHKISPTKNTFLLYVHAAGELGAHKIVQMAYLWTMKTNTSTIQQEVNIINA